MSLPKIPFDTRVLHQQICSLICALSLTMSSLMSEHATIMRCHDFFFMTSHIIWCNDDDMLWHHEMLWCYDIMTCDQMWWDAISSHLMMLRWHVMTSSDVKTSSDVMTSGHDIIKCHEHHQITQPLLCSWHHPIRQPLLCWYSNVVHIFY